MALTYPIVEQIAQALAAQVATVTAANGYQVTVSQVLRPTRTGMDVAVSDFGVVLLAGDATREAEEGIVGNPPAIEWSQSFTLDLCRRPSETADTPIDQAVFIFAAEATKAVMADVHWGGLAIDTHLAALEFMRDPEGGYEGATLSLEIRYRVLENDPYTQV